MSTQITASMVKELRDKTGAGMMDAKKALQETDGDMEQAVQLLRQKGMATADKKSGRTAAEGLVIAKLSDNQKEGVLVELNCETDFVARGEDFGALAAELSGYALASTANDADQFLKEQNPSGETFADYIKEKIGVIKENITLRRLTRYKVGGSGTVCSYIHMGSKIGVLMDLETGDDSILGNDTFLQLAKDLTMHVASCAPEFLSRDDIPADVVEAEKQVEMGREDLQNKPVEIREKIVVGRLDKILGQRTLLEQPFVKDPSLKVIELLEQQGKALGQTVTVKRFVRYLLGEGIEKVQTNFADEVMAQVNA
ncbi:MAG: elongation factor Ts [Cyanobacteria bacterium HKST-UBA06]|nr:elongation factor Ts [Cyanobacteria bacterium HKST-UBA05]MCA9799003.1 elongation factor Ts [Cyanobacteria bacterium HKST-UBA04]MCA9807025.1 elongation factor Ts [Cyanobacteria bacterium HKST-UBA06]MCA9842382.1 elongation factor Ts [Cyanobacteria bacterium HKST-UBA03]